MTLFFIVYITHLFREFYTERHIQAVKQFLELISTSSNTGIIKQRPTIFQEQPVVLKEGCVKIIYDIYFISLPIIQLFSILLLNIKYLDNSRKTYYL